jgi:hypothetical protein
MRSFHRLAVASTGAIMLLSGLLLAAPTAARAFGDAPVTIGMLTQNGAVERGNQVNLTGLITWDTSVPDQGWWLDGHPFAGLHVGDDGGSVSLQDPPGLPAGEYSRDDVAWDTTTATDGPHTITYWADVYNDAGPDTAYQVTATVVVNNAPIGMAFSDQQHATVHGAAHQTDLTVQPQGSPVKVVTFSGDLVPPAQRSDYLAPYTAMLDLSGAKNGAHTVVATAHDAAGVSTVKLLTLNVHNVSTLTVTGPKKVNLADSVTITIKDTARFPAGQKVLIQQKVLGAWTTVQKVTLGASGRKGVTNHFGTPGRKSMRVITASSNYWPGTSNVYSVVVS